MKTGVLSQLALLIGMIVLIAVARHLVALDLFDPASLQGYVGERPVIAAGVFVAAYAACVLLFVPTLPFNLAAGLLWGGLAGGMLSTLAATVGSIAAFVVARTLFGTRLNERLRHLLPASLVATLDRPGWRTVAFCRLNPAVPTCAVNYVLGATSLPLKTYGWATLVFFAPAAFAFAVIGEQSGTLMTSRMASELVDSVVITLAAVSILLAISWLMWAKVGTTNSDKGGRVSPVTNARPDASASPAGGVTLVVMTLNEIDGMRAIMPHIERGWVDQILVVDGGSTDGTVEWARANGYEVYTQKRKGVRHAYFEAWPLIRGEYVLTFSPDGNSLAEAVPALVDALREGYDLVIASRYLPGAGSDDDDRYTAFGNWLFTRTVNLLYRTRYTDVMVMLRGYRKSLAEELDLLNDGAYSLPERLFGTTISWEPLMSVRAAKAKRRIGEIAMAEPRRVGGERKLQIWRWGAAYYLQFWLERVTWLGRR